MEFESEDLAPDVDWDLLRSLVRREVSRELAADTYRLVYQFKSWHDAHSKALIEEHASSTVQNVDDPGDALTHD